MRLLSCLLPLLLCVSLHAARISPAWGPLIGSSLPVNAGGAAGVAARGLVRIRDGNGGLALETLAPVAQRLERIKLGGLPVSPEAFAALAEPERTELLANALEAEASRAERTARRILRDYEGEIMDRRTIARRAAEAELILSSPYFVWDQEGKNRVFNAFQAFKRSQALKGREVLSKARREASKLLRESLELSEVLGEASVPDSREELRTARGMMETLKEAIASLPRQWSNSGYDARVEMAGQWEKLIREVQVLLEAGEEPRAGPLNELLGHLYGPVAAYKETVGESGLGHDAIRIRIQAAEKLVELLEELRDRLALAEDGPDLGL